MLSVTKNTFANATNATSHNVPTPSGIVAGDLLLLFLSFDGNPTVTLPSGWFIQAESNPSNKGVFAIKRADGTEGASIAVGLSASEVCAAIIYKVHGSVNDPHFVFSSGNFSGDPVATPEKTLNWDAVEAVFISAITGFNTGSTTISSYPSGYTGGTDYQQTGTGTSHTAIASAYKIATAAAETPGSYDLSGSTSGLGITVAVVEFAIQHIDPDNTPINKPGSTRIRIAGVLNTTPDVYFGADQSPSVVREDDQTLSAVWPIKDTVQDVDVFIGNQDGTDVTVEDGFSYLPEEPRITEVTPPGAGLGVATPFTIKGRNFLSGATVEIDGESCTSIDVVDDETITAVSPIGNEQKLAVLVVENPDGQQATANFYYMAEVPTPPQPGAITAKFSVESVGYMA